MISYLLLLASAFLASTFFPFSSEVILAAMLLDGKPATALWLFATIGNTLGAIFTWLLGRYLLRFREKKWFPLKEPQLLKAQSWFQKYGVWSLLFSWLPVGGDGLPLVAGIMKVRLLILLPLCGIGKGLRYAAVIYLTLITT